MEKDSEERAAAKDEQSGYASPQPKTQRREKLDVGGQSTNDCFHIADIGLIRPFAIARIEPPDAEKTHSAALTTAERLHLI